MASTDGELVAQAVFNNAVWCDAVCSAHGAPGEFLGGVWINRHETPPSYPNVITLAGREGAASRFARARELVEIGVSGEWAIKDSFAMLDLQSSGFRLLFEAHWIGRTASEPPPRGGSDLRWAHVVEPSGLADWEAAWRAGSIDEIAQGRVFPSALLETENIAFVAGYRGPRIVAGAIANCTGSVVGVSNVFLPEDAMGHTRAGCLTSIVTAFPGRTVVGYERGLALKAMRALGFQVLAPLRVWLKTGRPAPSVDGA